MSEIGSGATPKVVNSAGEAEGDLRARADRFRRVFDCSPIGIAVIDAESRTFVDVNKSFMDLVGYTGQELQAKSVAEILHPDDWLNQEKIPASAGCPSRDVSSEKRFIRKDGVIRWVHVTEAVLPPDSGEALAVLTVFDVTGHRQAEEKLTASLAEKEVLLREVHHRIKNNLSSIIGLIDLQRSAIQEPDTVKMLAELSDRIRSMSLVHEKLYHSGSLSMIDCQDYLDDLIFQLRCSYESQGIHFDVTAADVEMPLESVVPCALIINELVTNALKYAFPNKRPRTENADCRITVSLTREEPRSYTLSVADNGVGLPVGLNWKKTKTMGLLLVRMLGQHQLGGTYQLDQDQGTRFTLTFSETTGRIDHE